jgi:hypothetical protein
MENQQPDSGEKIRTPRPKGKQELEHIQEELVLDPRESAAFNIRLQMPQEQGAYSSSRGGHCHHH